ncbi:MAG: sulfatase [Planctomycetota bacterium]|nr:sulfatase [Planctomycetota bacterium]
MRSLLFSLPFVVVALAALDTVLVRADVTHRPVEAQLFLEATGIWLAFGLAALAPAWLTLRILRRRRAPAEAGLGGARRAAPALLVWTAAPVVIHGTLDAFTSTGADVSGLAGPAPWLLLVLVLSALVAVAVALGGVLGRFPAARAALTVGFLAVGSGLFLPLRSGVDAAGSPGSPNSPGSSGSIGEGGHPNLLLLILDTCRRDRLQVYGYDRETSPGLLRFAREAQVYADARSVSCFTFTSHLSMLTGVLPSVHGARLLNARYDPRRADSIALLLEEAGYRTGAFVGTNVLAGRTGLSAGFEVYDDRVDPHVCDTRAWSLVHDVQALLAMHFPGCRNNGQPHWFQDFQRPAGEVLASALAWIEADDPRPWFAMVNLYDVHWPYVPGDVSHGALVRPYQGLMDGYLFRSDDWRAGHELDAPDRRHVSELYDAEIRDLDEAVDDFLAELDLERTAVLITSDHGEAFGEVETWGHEHVYEPQVRVPFLLRPPGRFHEPSIVPGKVSGIDVAPTLLGLAGIEPPASMQGLDLTRERPDPERLIRVEDRDHIDPTDVRLALYRGPWKLVRRGLGEEARFTLHDLRTDPIGKIDVQEEDPDVFRELVAIFTELRGDLDEVEARAEVDMAVLADALRALGYGGDAAPVGED